MKNINYLVFDIGGTFVKWAIVNSSYKILHNSKFPFNGKVDGAPWLFKEIKKILNNNKDKYNIKAIGISTAGAVDPKTSKLLGVVVNIKGFDNIDLKEHISKFTNLPIYVENDANAATIGEMLEDQVSKFDNVLMLTLGTDIGGGVIINKQLYHGKGVAGEVGHQIIKDRRWGEYFSAIGLSKLVKEFTSRDLKTPEIIKSKDKSIIKVVNYWYSGLANGIANLITSMNFDAIIIGGGISESEYFKLPTLKEHIDFYLGKPQFIESYKLFKAKKGNNAAILGMADVINKNMYIK